MNFPFDPQAGLIVVPVRIWGSDGYTIAHLALDTGATGSLVNWDIALFVTPFRQVQGLMGYLALTSFEALV